MMCFLSRARTDPGLSRLLLLLRSRDVEHVIEVGHVAELHCLDGGGEFGAVALFLERKIPRRAVPPLVGTDQCN